MQNTSTKHFSRVIYYTSILGLLLLLLLSNNAVYAADNTESEPKSSAKKNPTEEDNPQKNKKVKRDKTKKKDTTKAAESQIEDSMANIEIIQQTLESLRLEIDNSKENTTLNRSSVQTIKDGLELIDEKLKKAYSGLDQSQSGITTNSKAIDKLTKELLTTTRELRANAADLVSQKSLIENNSIRLYEILIQAGSISEHIEKLVIGLESVKNTTYVEELKKDLNININRLWRLLAIILVFFAPLAFVLSSNRNHYKPLTDGIEQHQGVLLVCLGAFLGYFGLGFGFMYGTSNSGWVGTSSYLMANQAATPELQTNFPFTEFVLYQTGFAMLAAMIVYIAVGRQLSSAKHMMLALFVGAVLIPVFGHWAWAGLFVAENKGWLENLGFIDQGGSITINAVAAWFAFIVVLKLGRLHPAPKQANEEFDDPVYSTSAVLLLWLSWFGFTTGTLPISNEQISSVMLNVGLAGSAGGLTAYLHYALFHSNTSPIARGLGGFVTGLVAIAACAQSVTFLEAIVIGASAGILQNISYGILRRVFLQQIWQTRAAYLVAIHGIGGIWGALCVALLGTDGNFGAPDMLQLVIQLQGIAAALAYSFVMANIMMFLLKFRSKRSKAVS